MLKSVGLWPYQNVLFKNVVRVAIVAYVYSIMIPQVEKFSKAPKY